MTPLRSAKRPPAGLPEHAATRKRRENGYERLDEPTGQRRWDYTTDGSCESIAAATVRDGGRERVDHSAGESERRPLRYRLPRA